MQGRPKTIIYTKYKDTLDYLEEQIPLHRNRLFVWIVKKGRKS